MSPSAFSSSSFIRLLHPARLGLGPDARHELIAYLREVGVQRPVLLIAGSVAQRQEPWLETLRQAYPELPIRAGFETEPTVADLETLRADLDKLDLDAVIAVGGGSVLDLGKLIAALHRDPEPVSRYLGNGLLPPRPLRFIAAPTTAGAGSEASPNAILYDEAVGLKSAVISPLLIPDAVFIDPVFAATLPPKVTAATGFDAMCHCIEAYANLHAHPAVDFYALEGIRLIGSNLQRAVEQGDDLAARTALGLGSFYGGLCLGPVNTAAVHALSYPLGSRYRLPHGLSNAILMPSVFAFNLPAAPERYAAVARALGVTLEGDDTAVASAGIEHLRTLAAACSLNLSLARFDVSAADLDSLATDALKVTRLLRNNPREVTFEDARSLYQQVFSA